MKNGGNEAAHAAPKVLDRSSEAPQCGGVLEPKKRTPRL